MAQAFAGNPTRFLTLTINPRVGDSPDDRLKRLSWAWRTIVKRLKRERGPRSIAYLAIVEATKKGEPHLHILVRSKYISQAWLSHAMAELADSPIVDIRSVKNSKDAIAYVAKYVTKQPAQFHGSKRYWMSQDWEEPTTKPDPRDDGIQGSWELWRMTLADCQRILEGAGYRRLNQYTDDLRMAHYWRFPEGPT